MCCYTERVWQELTLVDGSSLSDAIALGVAPCAPKFSALAGMPEPSSNLWKARGRAFGCATLEEEGSCEEGSCMCCDVVGLDAASSSRGSVQFECCPVGMLDSVPLGMSDTVVLLDPSLSNFPAPRCTFHCCWITFALL